MAQIITISHRATLLGSVILSLVFSCKGYLSDGEYTQIGQFDNRAIAERKALAYLSSNFESLSAKRVTKVMYNFDSDPGVGTLVHTHALNYNKASQELAIETDPQSGATCRWAKVDKSVLNQLVTADKGLVLADSLATPLNQGHINCYAK